MTRRTPRAAASSSAERTSAPAAATRVPSSASWPLQQKTQQLKPIEQQLSYMRAKMPTEDAPRKKLKKKRKAPLGGLEAAGTLNLDV